MFHSIEQLNGSTLTATDGDIGHVKEVYFDDKAWAVRYLVADTGKWLAGREVLISPYAVKPPLGLDKRVDVALSREQVRDSPPTDTHQPVSRRHERELLSYYAYPEYWTGDTMWAMSAMPLIPPGLAPREHTGELRAAEDAVPAEDVHLRSSANVSGYDIVATDGSIGHVKDYIFDDETWAIRYLVVDTRNWWPGGKKVLVATRWIDSIDWGNKTVQVRLTREQVKASPEYQEAQAIDRDYETRLHEVYDRQGYWI